MLIDLEEQRYLDLERPEIETEPYPEGDPPDDTDDDDPPEPRKP